MTLTFRKIRGHSLQRGSLGIPEPWSSVESVYNTYKAASGELLGSFLGGTALNYVGHRDCVCRDSLGARKERKWLDMTELDRQKGLMGGQEINSLKR